MGECGRTTPRPPKARRRNRRCLLDGELDTAAAAEVQAWLQAHPESAARVRQWAADRDALRTHFAQVLTEPVPFYLGDAALPDGQTMENLEAARLHIDLLDVLRQRTAGNLTAQEQAVLEDLLYRLRVRYVQKRG